MTIGKVRPLVSLAGLFDDRLVEDLRKNITAKNDEASSDVRSTVDSFVFRSVNLQFGRGGRVVADRGEKICDTVCDSVVCDAIVCDQICDSISCDTVCDTVCDSIVCDAICDGILCDGVLCDAISCDNNVCDSICASVCDQICDQICDGIAE